MAFNAATLIFATIALCAVSSMAAEYEVGESAGWDIMEEPYYQAWASTKNFHAGDILVFNYDYGFHTVEQVTYQDFQSCNPTSPLATYDSGTDTVTVDKSGHYYFICGVPSHCLAGMKLHVSVTAPPSPNPSPAPFPIPTDSNSAPTPTLNPIDSNSAPTPTLNPIDSNSAPIDSTSAPTPIDSTSAPTPTDSTSALTLTPTDSNSAPTPTPSPINSNSDISSSSEVLVMSAFFWGLVVSCLVLVFT